MEHGSSWLLIAIALVSFALSFIGAAVGLILGHLRLPLLIAYLGSPGAGAAANLIISGTGALAGTFRHAREGRVSWVGLAIMGIPSAIGAIIAILIFAQINPFWSYLVIGIILVVSGIKLIRSQSAVQTEGDISWSRRIVIEVTIGLGLGALAAITGLMLGSLRLPMMIRYLKMDPKQAIGTNMAVGCITGLIGAAASFMAGRGGLNWLLLSVVIPPTVLGGYCGSWVTGRFSKSAVQKMAGWIICITGVILLGQGIKLAVKKPPKQVPPIVIDRSDSDFDGYFDFEEAEPEAEEMPTDNS